MRKSTKAIPKLLPLLSSPAVYVRITAVQALSSIGDSSVRVPLERAAEREKDNAVLPYLEAAFEELPK